MITVVAVLAVAGVGFAAFTAQATVNSTGTAGTAGLAIYNFTTGTNDGNLACTGVNSGAWLNITAGPFAPGDWCQVFGNVTNTGNLPLQVLANWPHAGSNCFNWNVTLPNHNVNVPPKGHLLQPGGMEKFQFTMQLNGTASNSCEGQVGEFWMYFNGVSPP
jgi:hypothetical protein